MTTEANIYTGCKNPDLIEDYIEAVRHRAKEKTLQELKEEVEKLIALNEEGDICWKEDVITLIDEAINE